MNSVEGAKQKLFDKVELLSAISIPVSDSLGFVLANDIFSPIDIPQFDQSAMDGYAICFNEIANLTEHKFEIVGELKAGDTPSIILDEHFAVRIFTGAAIPQNTSTVVVQEKVKVEQDTLVVFKEDLLTGKNIRKAGSAIHVGDIAVKNGAVINAGAVGFIYSLGITNIDVIKKPKLAVVATGNELVKPGENLLEGQIFESNSYTIQAALRQSGFNDVIISTATDDLEKLTALLQESLHSNDVLIVSGGVSVGKYDFVRTALETLNVEEIFYKVSQKPGKPLYAGKFGKKLIFGLPGNPAAALMCFYEYVLPAIRKMSGIENYSLKSSFIPIGHQFFAKGDRALFLKAKVKDDVVFILDKQDSNMLEPFVRSNAIVYLPVGERIYEEGENVEVHFLPF